MYPFQMECRLDIPNQFALSSSLHSQETRKNASAVEYKKSCLWSYFGEKIEDRTKGEERGERKRDRQIGALLVARCLMIVSLKIPSYFIFDPKMSSNSQPTRKNLRTRRNATKYREKNYSNEQNDIRNKLIQTKALNVQTTRGCVYVLKTA